MGMDAFELELMRRSPLAACVLEMSDYVFDDTLLADIWDTHRGRNYEAKLTFTDFLRLTRDALVRHDGSAHRLFVQLEREDAEPIDESNYYRKLARMPVEVSRALLREGSQRLLQLMPQGACAVTLPSCFDCFATIVGDGKKIKRAAKRLKPTRGYAGKLIGATALDFGELSRAVALDLRSGLALAMSDSLDGMTNDVPLVPLLMPQLHALIADRPILSVWDRQFDDVATMRHLSSREGDAFVVRMKQMQTPFAVESSAEHLDTQGRRVTDEIGVMGRGKKAMRVRRVTLHRSGDDEEDVVLVTNLLDATMYSAADLLALYRHRWGIEQMFQQVTETFSLEHLIGSSPQAVLLQFAYCLLLYNQMQVVKAYMAKDGAVLASAVSMFYLFKDVREELIAWAYHTDGTWPRTPGRDAAAMRKRLRELLKGRWDPIAYTKASDKKPRPKPKAKPLLHGGYTSVQRLLEGKVRLAAP